MTSWGVVGWRVGLVWWCSSESNPGPIGWNVLNVIKRNLSRSSCCFVKKRKTHFTFFFTLRFEKYLENIFWIIWNYFVLAEMVRQWVDSALVEIQSGPFTSCQHCNSHYRHNFHNFTKIREIHQHKNFYFSGFFNLQDPSYPKKCCTPTQKTPLETKSRMISAREKRIQLEASLEREENTLKQIKSSMAQSNATTQAMSRSVTVFPKKVR